MGFVLLMSAKLGKFSDELLPPSYPISCVSDSLTEPLMTNLSCFFLFKPAASGKIKQKTQQEAK